MLISYKLARVSAVCLAAIIISFSLFVLMSKLVEDNNSHAAPKFIPVTVTLGKVDDDSKTNEIEKKLPEKPEIKPIPKPTVVPESNNGEQQTLGELDWAFELQPTHQQTSFSGQQQNTSALPIVRVTPNYPSKAAAEGVEGWVQLSFTIDEIGKVIDVEVVDAKPKRMFNREAKKALRKWKYRPKVVDGIAVKQFGQSVVLEFSIAQS